MKIAIITPPDETSPPTHYGAIEWITHLLAQNLGKKGHEVHLYAAGNSKTSPFYRLISISPQSIRSNREIYDNSSLRETSKLMCVAEVLKHLQSENYDLINNHFDWRFLIFADLLKDKIITTHHKPLSIKNHQLVYRNHKNLPHIALSQNQKKDLPDLNFVATILNGVDIDSIKSLTASSENQSYTDLIFLGRISHTKGAIEAAQTAIASHHKLNVAAKIESLEIEYYKKFDELIAHSPVSYCGELDHNSAIVKLSQSRALLMPINYEDPCPLVPLESMATGTPVIAYARGALPEQIVDGVTGFLVNHSTEDIRGNFQIKKCGLEGLHEAVERMYSLSPDEYQKMRRASRAHAEQHFTIDRMVDEYEKVFQKLLSK